jgi:20S proteasome alpha/beta subunit
MADDSQHLVLAADRMQSWTVGMAMPVQIETDDIKKLQDLSDSVVALSSGAATWAFEILRSARSRIGTGAVTTAEVAEIVRQEYQEYRRQLLVHWMLEPRGLDLATYLANQQVLDQSLVRQIDEQFAGYDMQTDFIVAGHDYDACHIYTITNPGLLNSMDAIGFACIGSGSPHAVYHLIGEDYSKSLSQDNVRELVLAAKKKSEKAPGVGSETDIIELPREVSNGADAA